MNIRSLIVATTILAAGTGMAFAQSSPAPANQSGPGVTATPQQPTDQGAVGVSGNTKATPSKGAAAKGELKGSAMKGSSSSTTGMGSARGETQQKNKSPGAQSDSIDKVK